MELFHLRRDGPYDDSVVDGVSVPRRLLVLRSHLAISDSMQRLPGTVTSIE